MASTGVDVEGARLAGPLRGAQEGVAAEKGVPGGESSTDDASVCSRADHTHRRLKSRHIQLIGASETPPGPGLAADGV